MPQVAADTLIEADWVLPIEPSRQVFNAHALVIKQGRIAAILPIAEAREQYAARQTFNLKGHVLIPGLINLHTHAAMTLLRGVADDRPLMEWLSNYIWPLEKQYVSHEFVRDGTLLACAELLRGGVTCFNDMYFFPEATVEAVLLSRMRAGIGMVVIELATAYARNADEYLAKGFNLRDQYLDHPLLRFCVAPHGPYMVSDRSFEKIAAQTAETMTPLHIHIHETAAEVTQSIEKYGVRPLARLDQFGLLSPSFLGVHAVHLLPEEIDLLARYSSHIAHCPTSNLKLASGMAPVAQLLEEHINVGLGTDGAASNNKLDMFSEMRLAALLAKGLNQADSLPAHQALEMATINAACALGWQKEIGSLAIGKLADIAAVDLSEIETTPVYDVAAQLVYTAGRENVSHVWINGELVMENRKLTYCDTADLKARANYWREILKP